VLELGVGNKKGASWCSQLIPVIYICSGGPSIGVRSMGLSAGQISGDRKEKSCVVADTVFEKVGILGGLKSSLVPFHRHNSLSLGHSRGMRQPSRVRPCVSAHSPTPLSVRVASAFRDWQLDPSSMLCQCGWRWSLLCGLGSPCDFQPSSQITIVIEEMFPVPESPSK
jgi:hypothetical protein